MFETEVKRRIKKEPAIAIESTQKSWFPSPDHGNVDEDELEVGVIQRDLVDNIWTFS